MGAEYLELANTQYYSGRWRTARSCCPRTNSCGAPRNAPTRRARLGNAMRILFVAPDYHDGTAQALRERLGRTFLNVAPDGVALPCHTARMLPGLAFPSVRETQPARHLVRLEGFNATAATGWMKEPCRSCEHREAGPRRLPLPGLHADRRRTRPPTRSAQTRVILVPHPAIFTALDASYHMTSATVFRVLAVILFGP
jgi:hypothetical protein